MHFCYADESGDAGVYNPIQYGCIHFFCARPHKHPYVRSCIPLIRAIEENYTRYRFSTEGVRQGPHTFSKPIESLKTQFFGYQVIRCSSNRQTSSHTH